MAILDDATNSLSHWNKHYIWDSLYGATPDPAAELVLTQIGEILNEVRGRRPERFPDLSQLSPATDPLDVTRTAMKPLFDPEDADLPTPHAKSLLGRWSEILKELEKVRRESSPVDPSSEPTLLAPNDPPAEVIPDPGLTPPPSAPAAGWRISLYLRKIHCKKETAPEALTDDFRLLGSYQYGTKPGELHPQDGEFDTNTQKTYSGEHDPNGRLLATELIPQSQDTVEFSTTVYAFEDDGMSATGATLLAGLLGNLATLGINGLMSFATSSGVALPPEAKQAYDNLGLPFIIGFLAKAFGPEPFIPVEAYARTRWPDPTAAPKWEGKIPAVGGERRTHIGAETHDGNVTMDEASWEVPIAPVAGQAKPALIAKADGGKYYVYLRYVVERA